MKAADMLTPSETAKRRDDAIRRALNTPPQPVKDRPKKRPKKADATAADASTPSPPEAS